MLSAEYDWEKIPTSQSPRTDAFWEGCRSNWQPYPGTARTCRLAREGHCWDTENLKPSQNEANLATCRVAGLRGMRAGPFMSYGEFEFIAYEQMFIPDFFQPGDRVTAQIGHLTNEHGIQIGYPPLYIHHIHAGRQKNGRDFHWAATHGDHSRGPSFGLGAASARAYAKYLPAGHCFQVGSGSSDLSLMVDGHVHDRRTWNSSTGGSRVTLEWFVEVVFEVAPPSTSCQVASTLTLSMECCGDKTLEPFLRYFVPPRPSVTFRSGVMPQHGRLLPGYWAHEHRARYVGMMLLAGTVEHLTCAALHLDETSVREGKHFCASRNLTLTRAAFEKAGEVICREFVNEFSPPAAESLTWINGDPSSGMPAGMYERMGGLRCRPWTFRKGDTFTFVAFHDVMDPTVSVDAYPVHSSIWFFFTPLDQNGAPSNVSRYEALNSMMGGPVLSPWNYVCDPREWERFPTVKFKQRWQINHPFKVTTSVDKMINISMSIGRRLSPSSSTNQRTWLKYRRLLRFPPVNASRIADEVNLAHAEPAGSTHSHRTFVGRGDRFDDQSGSQFTLLFLLGLKGNSSLLDVGCGSLRLGRLAIAYLNPKRYHCIEPNIELLRQGIAFELGRETLIMKEPSFTHNTKFQPPLLEASGQLAFASYEYIIAQSIFNHMGVALLGSALTTLRSCMDSRGLFLATVSLYDDGKQPTSPCYVKRVIGTTWTGWHDHPCVSFERSSFKQLVMKSGLSVVELAWPNALGDTWVAMCSVAEQQICRHAASLLPPLAEPTWSIREKLISI